MSKYQDVYGAWQADPEGFWAKAAEDIDWYKPWESVQASVDGLDRWFVGAECNTCYNCLDRQIENGRGEQAALIYDSPITGNKKTYTYNELLHEVSTLAAVLKDRGVEKGDRVIIYMPMIPESAFAMLACARIGAVHSVVFGGFAPNELAVRIDDAKPKLVLTASCGIEPNRVIAYKPLLDDAIEIAAHKPDSVLLIQREQEQSDMIDGRDFDWATEVAKAKEAGSTADCVPVLATDPLYVLYTSGTTGVPKGVVRDNGGHMVALKWTMKNVYGIDPGEAFWAASDVGWVVGHSYIVYGPLLHGCTTVLFEGKPVGTPDAGVFWRVIEEHNIVSLFTAPTAFRAIKKEDPNAELMKNYDLSKFRTLFLAGERADPDTIIWAENSLKVPVIDHWWQTELGYPAISNPVGIELLPVKRGSPTVALPGFDIRVLDESQNEVAAGDIGAIVIKRPLPPGTLPTLWEKDDRFNESYMENFPGYYETADAGFIDEDGYIYIMARTDDIINVAGHRLSTGGMEEVLAGHPDVAECAVLGVADKLKGQMPIGFLVLNAGVTRDESEIIKECVQSVREQIGPVAAFKTAMIVKRLPKTRSGKILRATIRKIADGEEWKMPATIDDPVIIDEIMDVMKEAGLLS